MEDKLQSIAAKRREDVKALLLDGEWLALLKDKAAAASAATSLLQAVEGAHGRSEPIIATEFKRASPSKGPINTAISLEDQVADYTKAGAHIISVLTEPDFFKGSIDDLQMAKQVAQHVAVKPEARPLILRKELSELIELSRSLGMEPLVEAANESEMLAAVQAGARVIGVNNRDLRSFKVDLGTTARLISHARTNSEVCATQPVFVLSLSGIRGGQDVASVASQCSPPHPSQANGVHLAGILVGEALMKASDPAALVREMREAFAAGGWGSSSTLTLGGLVKVCGLTNKEDALHAARAGAHMLGFIRVPGSRRCVDVAVTQGIVDAVRAYREQDPAADLQRGMGAALQAAQASSETSSLSREGLLASANSKAACAWFNAFWREGLQPAATRAPPLTVGVYQNMPMQEVAADAAACGFDIVQLHGDEAADAALHLPEGLPAIRVVHLPPSTADCADPSGSAGTCAAVLPHVVPGGAAVLLIDARRAGQQGGGTGAAVDWLGLGELPSALAASGTGHAALPFIVAGGVTAHNVQQAVTESGATGVDVSSGVEASGHGTAPRKDPASVTAYVSSAKKALASTLAKGDNPQEQGEDCSAAAAAADGASAPPTS